MHKMFNMLGGIADAWLENDTKYEEEQSKLERGPIEPINRRQ
jgi:hypothetical protein